MHDPVLLLSEASQRWQNVVSDQLVYLLNPADRDVDTRFQLSENYNRGQCWLEAFIGTPTDYIVAVISSLNVEGEIIPRETATKCASGDSGNHRPYENPTVLVDPVQFVELPQQVCSNWRTCRSIVRLKRFDERASFIRYATDLPAKSSLGVGIIGFAEDRELCPVGVGMLQVRERPDSLVQGRPEALNNIRSDQENADMGVTDMNAVANGIAFSVFIHSESIWLRVLEFDKGGLEFVKVYLRPLGLEISVG